MITFSDVGNASHRVLVHWWLFYANSCPEIKSLSSSGNCSLFAIVHDDICYHIIVDDVNTTKAYCYIVCIAYVLCYVPLFVWMNYSMCRMDWQNHYQVAKGTLLNISSKHITASVRFVCFRIIHTNWLWLWLPRKTTMRNASMLRPENWWIKCLHWQLMREKTFSKLVTRTDYFTLHVF